MNSKQIWMGNTSLYHNDSEVKGGFTTINGEQFYRISNYDQMPDFFMTIVSDSDHWMFISSNGSLSAGRKDRDNALFPYYTDDKIHDYAGITGSKTQLLVENNGKTSLWQPFNRALDGFYKTERNIYKSVYSNKLIFEEINHDLGLKFSYGWYNTDKFGFVRRSFLSNLTDSEIQLSIMDGVANLLPSGTGHDFQNAYSNLLDGYKKTELIESSRLGLIMLSAVPVDKAEPSEALRANTVWGAGLDNSEVLLSNKQWQAFSHGEAVSTEFDVKGTRGAFYQCATLTLAAEEQKDWLIVAEINQNASSVANLSKAIEQNANLVAEVLDDVVSGTKRLRSLVAAADGLQTTSENLSASRHYSNTLYNIMRGGIYLDNYQIDRQDFADFFKQANTLLAECYADWLSGLPKTFSHETLIESCQTTNNADVIRLGYEYLPLTFSRRHGDPSRPWNLFSIVTKNEDGSPVSDYQGNWRDIFQTWEALSLSYPEFIENIICKFLNASTADGYNPYRIMKNGIDWECPEPNDPWAYIGYWGDHQIIYLQKLLELSEQFHPGKLDQFMQQDIFAYANVPYRIKSYDETVLDPQNTIDFDHELNDKIVALTETNGSDARLILDDDGQVYRVNFCEKILLTLLTKMSNFIPDAGIWLNTQRPEWNDANNALVGNGVSVVTLCYVRRFVKFWLEQLDNATTDTYQLSREVYGFMQNLNQVFANHADAIISGVSNEQRKAVIDALGQYATDYRNAIYDAGFSGEKSSLGKDELMGFLNTILPCIDASIRSNRREDGLYHAYNLVAFSQDEVSIRYLYEMLEGQVAVLSSGLLSGRESLAVLDALKNSALFRENQYSYLLYPDRELARFVEKNNIPREAVETSALMQKLLADELNPIVRSDKTGQYHFCADFHNADYLADALDALDKSEFGDLVAAEKQLLLDVYEQMFDHQSFTGRSGTFYAYEGLGSIYWHMVSKLLLAANESFYAAVKDGSDPTIIGQIKAHYYEIKAGIGIFKSPALYGAFPTDAYSHTVRDAGVKQPGMTGQVKEDILSRLGELGAFVEGGEIHFDLSLINQEEFLDQPVEISFVDVNGNDNVIELQPGQLAFSLCQVPIIYSAADEWQITIQKSSGDVIELAGNTIPAEYCNALFLRQGEIKQIQVAVSLT